MADRGATGEGRVSDRVAAAMLLVGLKNMVVGNKAKSTTAVLCLPEFMAGLRIRHEEPQAYIRLPSSG
jgi:hypothetical protein